MTECLGANFGVCEEIRREGPGNRVVFLSLAKNLKISDEIIIKAVNKFAGLPHRQETVFSNKELLCINDSKATSFDASLQSLTNYNNIYWILGGIPKYQDSFNLQHVKQKIVKPYIIGKNTNFFVKKIYLPDFRTCKSL